MVPIPPAAAGQGKRSILFPLLPDSLMRRFDKVGIFRL